MRLLMMGTGPFAVPTFRALLDSPHEVLALVTRPTPQAKGREKASLNPMRDLAEERGLTIYAPDSINTDEAKAQLSEWNADLFVVCDYGQILSRSALGLAPLGGINLHASLLPKFRGAAPINWAILAGEEETGITVIHMTPRLDGGPCLVVCRTPIGSEETAPELEKRLSEMGVGAVLNSIDQLAKWDRFSPIGSRQPAELITKAPRLAKTDGQIDWTKSAAFIQRQVRALKPWPTTYTHWLRAAGEPLRVIIDRVTILTEPAGAEAGTVVSSDGQQLVIATGEGRLAIDALQPAGKRVLQISEFLRGYPVKPGDRFGA
ncbi:Methionyl-tRNA formyltransferase [Anatilimnocola aggregata]|uniref:Methionyl-tRNA formyltransferase n=1 Tax=Anatilimnocola aggregata TaxID=2528021 RepID=A0A517YL28_9BACT|nr:methionyl-tRNA formyltransferase [Anatilimnocola aggregata]QDU30931.1 Methionyl-tRNA formyltransferase [Anatilimnocola aggregata]